MYRNFELQLLPAAAEAPHNAGAYQVVATIDGARPSAYFQLPISLQQSEFPQPGALQDEDARWLGDALFRAIFRDDILSAYRDCKKAAGVRLQLRLSIATELARLPWELLYDQAAGGYCALTEGVSVTRVVDQPFAPKALHMDPPIRLLAVLPMPIDAEPLDSEAEWARLKLGLTALVDKGWFELNRLQPATAAALERYDGVAQIFHFTGHGDLDNEAGGVLAFEGNGRVLQAIGEDDLMRLLQERDLRLAVLNACRSASTASQNRIYGLAGRMLRAGIPAVIAMQGRISEARGTLLAQHLYRELGFGAELDDAVRAARRALARNGQSDWATPVLFLQSATGRLFDLPEAPAATRRELELRGLVAEAEAEVRHGQWDVAALRLPELERLGKNDPDAQRVIVRLQRLPAVVQDFAEGERLFQAREWTRAWTRYDKVQAAEGDCLGVYGRISECLQALSPTSPEGDERLDVALPPLVDRLSKGQLAFMLGSHANRIGRLASESIDEAFSYAPDHTELARYLAASAEQQITEAEALPLVAEYLATKHMLAPYQALNHALDREWSPCMLHGFLARLPSMLRARGVALPCQAIFTVNYDDALERAFDEVGEPYDVLRYVPEDNRHVFVHHAWRAPEPVQVRTPNQYSGLPIEGPLLRRCLIVKVYGDIDRKSADLCRSVVTEDDYIDYAQGMSVHELLPVELLYLLERSSFLFLGYDLSAWNMRTFLKRVWRPSRKSKSWAVLIESSDVATRLWQASLIPRIAARPEQLITAISARLKGDTA